MREIKFRGKTNNGYWVYGGYAKHLDFTPCIYKDKESAEKDIAEHTHYLIIKDGFSDYGMSRDIEAHEVDKNTIGQFTGERDSINTEIFEDDIIEMTGSKGYIKYLIEAGGFVIIFPPCTTGYINLDSEAVNDIKVIGNLHDNPELLEI